MDEPARRMICGRERRQHDPHKANRISSYVIPPLLVLCASYSCYAFFYMAIAWYLRNGRTTTGVCLLAFHLVLLTLMGASFFRIAFTPAGYVPNAKDRRSYRERHEERHGAGEQDEDVSSSQCDAPAVKTYGRRPSDEAIKRYLVSDNILQAPIYLADRNGTDTPRFCHTCDAFKHDRSHHCNEVNRCVIKQDHFCPWVGGPLGHTRYKFFVQFITYVALYSLYCFIALTIASAERIRAVHRADPRHIPAAPSTWYVGIGMAIFFAMFMIPFSAFHLRLVVLNCTTIESLNMAPVEIIVNRRTTMADGRVYPDRQRIVLRPGLKPFDLGPWRNLQAVFGRVRTGRHAAVDLLHWLLPVRESPGDGLFHEYSALVEEEIKLKLKA